MRIRYYAQRKHVIYSLDSLLYELHTLSFVLAPSIFVLLCRCITQFQFSRARELDGRRSLRFWFMLVALVNVSAVWAHAFDGGGGGRGGAGGGHGAGEEKSVILDFVGMGHKPTKVQLLLLDATIMFLQAILTTISYETSLSHAMPSDAADPLFPTSSSISTELSSNSEETAPFLPYSSPDTSSIALASSATTYPPTPPIPTSASLTRPDASTEQPSSSSINNDADDDEDEDDNNNNSSSNSKPTPRDPLPPPVPIIDLSLRQIIHRLTSPIPELPSSRTGAGAANEGLDGGDDELAVLRLPLPNTTSVRFAHTLRIFAQARQRQRQREREQQVAARRLRRASRADGGGNVDENGDENGDGDGVEGEGRGPGRGREESNGGGGDERRPRTARIPGAIEDEDEG